MMKLMRFIPKKKHIILGAIVILVVGWWFVRSSADDLLASITIEPIIRGDVRAVISETGSVVPAQEVNLAFERGGRVAEIPVKEGAQVAAGDVLIKLDATQQSADLAAAYARLSAEKLRLDELIRGADSASLAVTESGVAIAETARNNAQENLTKVMAQQDLLVKNALRTLRSSGLQAYLTSQERENSSYSYSAPTITGTYEGTEEGVYHIALYNSGSQAGSSFKITGLETGTQSVSTVTALPLGVNGLYIQFPENFASRTEWDIQIPNNRASGYLANLNAYNAVVEARDLAIASAESVLKSAEASLAQAESQLALVSGSARNERVAAQAALVEQMQSAVTVAQLAYDTTTIVAPFSGTVAAINTEVGQIVAPTAPVLSLISGNDLELLVNISESDIQEVNAGDAATAIFDAYRGVTANAHVVRVAPTAKIVDGVHVFEVRLQFDEKNDIVRSGLSTDIDIAAASRENVITVPSRAIIEKDGGKFVRTLLGTTLEYLPITVGLRGSNGTTEVIEGVSEGQKIITFAPESVIKQLELN